MRAKIGQKQVFNDYNLENDCPDGEYGEDLLPAFIEDEMLYRMVQVWERKDEKEVDNP